MKLTKQAFAKAVGTSKPTLYKWIAQNKDGIKDFVSDDGVDARIFDVEPWASMCKEKPAADQDAGTGELAQLRAEVETLRTVNEQNAKVIELLSAQIAAKDAQIQALLVISQTQLKALPKPRQTIKERWEAWKNRGKE